jgi:hypothetical protein
VINTIEGLFLSRLPENRQKMNVEIALGLTGFIVMLIAIDSFDRTDYCRAAVLAVLSVSIIEIMPFFHK